jgi:hypothetical protein
MTPMAFSRERDFDYVIMAVPDVIFSKLGMQKGKFANHLTHGSPVSIHQIIDGMTCYTIGLAQKADRPWMVSYAATTVEGTSGAPILNVRHEIVGVHTEGGTQVNTGVIPELLRSQKESPQNGDINADDDRAFEEELDEEALEQAIEDEIEYREYLESRYRQFALREVDLLSSGKGWAEIMEDLDEEYFDDDHEASRRFVTYVTPAGKTGDHINERIKGNRYRRKESPWTCTKCMALHLKAGYNCQQCGFALKRSAKEVVEDKKQAVKGKFPLVVEDKILRKLDDLSLKYQNLENLVSNQCAGFAPVDKTVLDKWFKELPDRVVVDRKLARKLNTTVGSQTMFGEQRVKIQPQVNKVTVTADADYDDKRPVTAQKAMEVEVIKKRNRRRKGKDPKEMSPLKETVHPSAVSLNLKSPSGDGVTTMSGEKKSSSQNAQLPSGKAHAASTLPKNSQKANIGNRQSN